MAGMNKTFKTRFMCWNCGNGSEHEFPYGTDLQASKRDDGTKAHTPATTCERATTVQVQCPHCGSERIGSTILRRE